MENYSQKEINYLVNQSLETKKWREYLTIFNKPSRYKRLPKPNRKNGNF